MAKGDSKHYALTRVKAGGKFYEIGDEVPKQDDSDQLVAAGVLGTRQNVKDLEKKAEEQTDRIVELEAQVADLTAQLEAAQLEATNAGADTQESVTDLEAEAAKQIGN